MYLTAHSSISPIRRGFAPSFVIYKIGCTRLAAASDKVYQLLAQGRWFSPSTTAPSTTKTGRHDIAEILLKVALNTKNSNSNSWQSECIHICCIFLWYNWNVDKISNVHINTCSHLSLCNRFRLEVRFSSRRQEYIYRNLDWKKYDDFHHKIVFSINTAYA